MPVISVKDGDKAWISVANDYNRIVSGLFSHKDARQLNSKWRNILYHARKFGYPHPLESQRNDITEAELIKQVKSLKSNPENSETLVTTDSKSGIDDLNSKNMESETTDCLAPEQWIKTIQTRKRNASRLDRGGKRLEKINIRRKKAMLELELQQEKLIMLRETHQLKCRKLFIEFERAKIELEREKHELAISKFEANKRGLLT